MEIKITYTRHEDIPVIFELYEDAISYQKSVGNNHWLGFEKELIEKEIAEQRHLTVTANGSIVATFCITLSDPLIWKDSNEIAAVYIHRIANSSSFRGNNLLQHIIGWAKAFATAHQLQYIRLDTGAGNDRLINYYIKNGFTLLGNTKVAYTPDLPAHYENGLFELLQLPV